MTEVYIYDAVRTPCGKGDTTGALFQVKPLDLLHRCLKALGNRNAFETKDVDDAILGCVVPFGDQGDNIMKTALLYSGWSPEVPGIQINRFQASGLEAISLAAGKITAGWGDLMIAGGLESSSRVKRSNFRGAISSDPNVINLIGSIPSGMSADLLATIHHIDRIEIDEYALSSQEKAIAAQKAGCFDSSIISIYDQNNILLLDQDEFVNPTIDTAQMTAMETIFPKWGRAGFEVAALKKYPLVERIKAFHTLGNIAPLADGAALILLGSKAKGQELGLGAKAKILMATTVSSDLSIMHLGGVKAADKALRQAQLKEKDIDLWYTNESFGALGVYFQKHFSIPANRLNACGGTIAFGEPIGALGAMLLSMLLNDLERQGLKRGLVSVSAEGGMGACMIIEVV